ncbi:ankyrin repeat-containing domain protein [Penicillium paradoxum]|uniref:ankyrin repeat-containing domain protein n=1 Tax=Penicillium paradoxum TaxID=176176 RepID=UPI0025470EE0|nr:ankyrin repeat-containing domain protein [Penicillium paradoxum]KAJ5772934.1 ankyrin repeat-containing domain protein [Penicillium paradoxum]
MSKDDSDRTMLSWLAENQFEVVVEVLIENGADLESKADSGRTPLLWAARCANNAVIKRLLDKGAKMHDEETATAVQECLEWSMTN